MSVWDKIDCGFSSADESVNFGTRAFAPGDRCIYEASTLATIRTTDEGAAQKEPQVCCQMCKTGTALAVDRTFAFFTRQCDRLIWKYDFDRIIKALHVPEDDPTACVFLDDFTIIRIDLETGKRLIFPPSCFPPNAQKSKFLRFVHHNDNAFSVFSSGLIVDMKNVFIEVDFGDQELVILDGNSPDHSFVEVTKNEEIQELVTAVSGLTIPCHLYLCANELLYSWSEEGVHMLGELYLDEKVKLKKVEETVDKRFIVCLSEDGELFLLSRNTLTFLFALTEHVVCDFVLIDSSLEGPMVGETATSVLYLTDEHELCLHDLDDGECTFRLAVSANVFMIDQQLNTEGVMYLDRNGDSIMAKVVEETAPESRLERLLQRGKFEQAKQFATVFRLDQESVLKAQVQWLMGTFSLWNRFDEQTLSANYSEMRSILESIKDVGFVAEVCIKTVAPDVQKTMELYSYAAERLDLVTNTEEALVLQPVIEKVRSLQLTLGTFLIVSRDKPSSEEWLHYSSRNPVLLCLQFISQFKMEEVMVVCRRHQREIESQLMDDTAETLLKSVPTNTPPSVLIEWLSCYVPILLKSHRNALGVLVEFVMERAKGLEMDDARNWPDNADGFVSSCQSVLHNIVESKMYGSVGVLAIQQGRSLPHSPINQLVSFQQHLKSLSVLRREYNIPLAYDLYYSGLHDEMNAKNFVLMLFDAVPNLNIEKLISEFIPSYNTSLYKDISSIVSSYVLDLIVRYLQSDVYGDEMYWEARCIAFINCINVIDVKLTTIANLVKFASLPWSDIVARLVETTLLIKHPLVTAVEEEKRRIPQKLILKKYGFSSDVDLSNMPTLLGFIYERNIPQDFPSMLEDGKQLVAHDSSLVLEPYIKLVIHAFEKDGLDDALDLCQRDLNKSEIEEVKEGVLRYTDFKLRLTRRRNDGFREKVLPKISKLSHFCANDTSSHGSAARLIAVCTINAEFQQHFKMDDLCRKPMEILEKCIDTLVGRNLDADQLVVSAANAASLVFESEDVGLIELADKCLHKGKLNAATVALRRLCDNNRLFETHSKRISELLKFAGQCVFNNSASSVEKSDLIEVLALTAQLNLIHTDYLSSTNDFLRLCKTFTVHHVKPSWSSSYTDPIESPHFILSPAISSTISSHFGGLGDSDESNGNLQEEMMRMCQELPKDLISLSRILEVTCVLARTTTMEPTLLKEIKQSITVICRNVLMSIFSDPRIPDLRLALSLLQNFQPDQILPWLQYVAKHKRDMKFSKNMSLAVNEYCALHQAALSNDASLNDASRYFSQLNKVSTWSLRAYRHGIPYKEALADTVEEQMKFLTRLIAVNDIELKVLESYCKDMGLDVQECYILYIKHSLLSWKPVYKIFKNSSGKKEIIFENNTHLLKLKCQCIVSNFHKPEELIKMLLKKEFWDQINTYHYEVFQLILETAKSSSIGASEKKFVPYLQALTFLQSYTRIGPVQDEESTEWFTSNPGVNELPEIAHYRLPYRSCPFPASMMPFEISIDNYVQWLRAPSFIFSSCTNKDYLCSLAIRNLKTTEPPLPVGNNVWNLHHCKRDLLDKIMQCVNEIPSIEQTVAVLYYVVNNLMPPGIDQVEAAQQCYIKADEWRRNVRSEEAVSKFAKAEKKYFTISTQHVLHASGLGKPEYLIWATEPTRLITVLYNDPAVIDYIKNNTANINQAVEKIIALHELDPVKIILELLTQWLHPEAALQATLNDSSLHCSDESDEDNITRACYMLLGNKNSAEIEKYLVGQAFPKNQDDTSKSHGVRLRALRILMAITTEQQLETITARDIRTIRSYLQVLDFLNELEKFGLVYTVSGFHSQRKEAILDTILHHKHPPAVRLALKMCRAYAIKDARVISKVLKLMMQLDMMDELKDALVDIPTTRVEVDVMKSCWNAVMSRAILKADGGTQDGTEVKKVKDLLYSCPNVNLLDLEPVMSFFVKVNDTTVTSFLNRN
uniref:Kinetochore-associated protein 1 n=2 Tax=Lygus hesperus TaxID=30085 RepID=A0A146LPZ9_LYGHE